MEHKETCRTCGDAFEWQESADLPSITCPYCGQGYSMSLQEEWYGDESFDTQFYLKPKGEEDKS